MSIHDKSNLMQEENLLTIKTSQFNQLLRDFTAMIQEDYSVNRWNTFIASIYKVLPKEISEIMIKHLAAIQSWKHQESQLRFKAETVEILQQIGMEITSLASLPQILSLICDKARDIFKTDIAYIALLDKTRGSIFVRVSSGTRTPEFLNLEQKLGKGIGGVVAKIKKPIIVSDYKTERRRDPDVEELIDKEGIRSLIAAPLLMEQETIGVLYVAMRTKHTFDEIQANLLLNLGYQAAIAIENARLYENEMRISKIHQQITRAAVNGNGFKDIIQTLADLLNRPVLMIDEFGNVVEREVMDHDNFTFLNHQMIFEKINTVYRNIQTSVNIELDGTCTCLVNPIYLHKNIVGYIIIPHSHQPLDILDSIAIEQSANVLALKISIERTSMEVELRLKQDYLNDLISGSETPETLLRRGRYLKFNFQTPHQIIVASISIKDKNKPTINHITEQLEKARYFLGKELLPFSMVQEKKLVIVTQKNNDCEHVAQQILNYFNQYCPHFAITIGISKNCYKPIDYIRGFREAKKSSEFAQHLGNDKKIVHFSDLGIFGLLFEANNLTVIENFCNEILGDLIDHDTKYESNLLTTLKVFLENESIIQTTAKKLHIHYNTLRYRLNKIQQISGLDFSNSEQLLNARLALTALKLIQKG